MAEIVTKAWPEESLPEEGCKPASNLYLDHFSVYEYLNRYGFDDGHRILPEERPFCAQQAMKLADMLSSRLTDWEPYVIHSGHNPYFVSFKNRHTRESLTYYDMGERERRKLDTLLDHLQEPLRALTRDLS